MSNQDSNTTTTEDGSNIQIKNEAETSNLSNDREQKLQRTPLKLGGSVDRNGKYKF